jgi:hypothetical protein
VDQRDGPPNDEVIVGSAAGVGVIAAVLVVGVGADVIGVDVVGVELIGGGAGVLIVPAPAPELPDEVVVLVPDDEPLSVGVVEDEDEDEDGGGVVLDGAVVVEDWPALAGCRTVGSLWV